MIDRYEPLLMNLPSNPIYIKEKNTNFLDKIQMAIIQLLRTIV